MSVEEDVMKIQKKLTKMTSDDGTVGVDCCDRYNKTRISCPNTNAI